MASCTAALMMMEANRRADARAAAARAAQGDLADPVATGAATRPANTAAAGRAWPGLGAAAGAATAARLGMTATRALPAPARAIVAASMAMTGAASGFAFGRMAQFGTAAQRRD